MSIEQVNFCQRCGHALDRAVLFGKTRPMCPSCGWVYFADPKVAVAVVVLKEGKVLLTQRSNEPQSGLWTLPAGFVDAGEDPAQAAERECLEETNLHVRVTGLLDVITGQEHERGSHILIAYTAEIVMGDLQPGDDASQVDFFSPHELPPLAFSTTFPLIQRATKSPPAR